MYQQVPLVMQRPAGKAFDTPYGNDKTKTLSSNLESLKREIAKAIQGPPGQPTWEPCGPGDSMGVSKCMSQSALPSHVLPMVSEVVAAADSIACGKAPRPGFSTGFRGGVNAFESHGGNQTKETLALISNLGSLKREIAKAIQGPPAQPMWEPFASGNSLGITKSALPSHVLPMLDEVVMAANSIAGGQELRPGFFTKREVKDPSKFFEGMFDVVNDIASGVGGQERQAMSPRGPFTQYGAMENRPLERMTDGSAPTEEELIIAAAIITSVEEAKAAAASLGIGMGIFGPGE